MSICANLVRNGKKRSRSGTAAAAAGGFTTIFCMPNTDPALDSVVALEELKRRTATRCTGDSASDCRYQRRAAAVSDRSTLTALAAAGAVGFSDDGDTTRHSGIMREALEASRTLGLPVMVHCEDPRSDRRRDA